MIYFRTVRFYVICSSSVAALICFLFAGLSIGQEQELPPPVIPLVEQKPYDLILLDEFNGNLQLKIQPLDEPLSDPLPQQGFLIFEAPDLNDERLQIPYQNIAGYRSFNDLLRAEANQYIREESYGKAFRNLIYIYDHGGKQDPKIANTIQNLVFRDAAKQYLSGSFELALTMFQDIYERDKDFEAPGISKRPVDLILDCLDKNISAKFDAEQYSQVRAAVDDLVFRYGEEAASLADQWRARLLKKSDELLVEARRIAASGNGQLAHLTARRANVVLPGRPEIIDLFQEILERFPIVFVGTSQAVTKPDPTSLDNWGARRVGKLTRRSVFEFAGPGDDGGKYEFLNGKFEQIDDNGFVFRLTIIPQSSGFATPPIDAYELSRRMLSRGSVNSDEYHIPFARVVDTIEIEDEFNVVVRLRIAFVRPEALFEFLYDVSDQPPTANGSYVQIEQQDEFTVYERNPAYPPLDQAQHPQVVEWKFPTASQAVEALITGEVDVVDRVSLADLNRLEENAAITTGSYIVPTVHMLVPNIRNDFTRDRSFRNGLKQGINRELILEDVICGGHEINGCEVISGPFPIGTEENDQLSYGYNLRVLPQQFNYRLGMVLARVIYESQLSTLVRRGAKNPKVEFPTLILAYSDEDVPEMACTNIQQMWAAIGIKVVLRKLENGTVVPPDDEWDFLYYQISMQEPLTDAERLFGRNGIVKQVGAPVEQNMQKLAYADSWQKAGKLLRQIHRQVVNDLTVIPLWQLKEHFAYRENLTGVGKTPVHLYEKVAFWRIVSTRKDK